MKLEIKKIVPETVQIYHDDYGFIGDANEYEFNSLRIDIKRNKLNGYYVLKNDTRYYINKNGTLDEWNFFDQIFNQLDELLDD